MVPGYKEQANCQKKLQVLIGRLAFCGLFILHGRSLMNSSYAAFAGAHKLQCTLGLVMVTEMYKDVTYLMLRINSGLWSPVTKMLWFAFPGEDVFPSDVSLRVVKDPDKDTFIQAEGGRGVHVFSTTAGAAWYSSTKPLIADKRLSIIPLELLTIAAAVVLLGTCVNIPDERRVVLRCDNPSV